MLPAARVLLLGFVLGRGQTRDEPGQVTPVHEDERSGTQPTLGVQMIRSSASTLGLYLNGITLKELGVHELEEVLDKSTFHEHRVSDSVTASNLAGGVSSKLHKYISLLMKSKKAMEDLYSVTYPLPPPVPSFPQCCDISPLRLKYSRNFGVAVQKDLLCDTQPPPGLSAGQTQPPPLMEAGRSFNLTDEFSASLASCPGLRWQYWISMEGRELVYPGWGNPGRPCDSQTIQHGQVFFDTLYKSAKNVVIILDRSAGMTQAKLELGKSTARFLLDLLGESDRVSILALDSGPVLLDPFPAESCLMGRLVPVTEVSRAKLRLRLDSLRVQQASANLKAGIKTALSVLKNSDAAGGEGAQILYITDGDKINLGVRQNISGSMLELVEKAGVRAKLSLVPLLHDKPEHLEALQTYWSSLVPEQNLGHVIPIFSNDSIVRQISSFYVGSSHQPAGLPVVHRPRLDPVGGGLVVSISHVVAVKDVMVGVVGLDVQAADLLENIAYTEFKGDARTFIIDENGYTLAHPLLDTPERWTAASLPLINTLEVEEGFDAALHRIKSFPSGNFVITANISYTWQHVEGSNYIVVVSAPSSPARTEKTLESVQPASDFSDIQYHNLIAEGKTKLCKHMREIASMQTAALYLSPAAYDRPFEHMSSGGGGMESLRIPSYMAYLTDSTRLIANPGLRPGVRTDVALLSQVVPHWKQLAFSSPLNNYIIRRRILTPRGVQLSYPGATLEDQQDPHKELWFTKTSRSAGRIVVSPPRLDQGGAGFVMTVSRALRASSSSEDNSYLAAVLSADISLGYLYKILNDTIPDNFCAQPGSRCFLLDDQGNMVAHPGLRREVFKHVNLLAETQHLTHMETFVATDILLSQEYMLKRVCRSQLTGKLQRFFQLDLANYAVAGNTRFTADQCTQYRVTAVPGTNLFLGLVQQDCNSSAAFCWCSTLDRTCLDCQTWEQGECECPCECDIKEEHCLASDQGDNIPPCESKTARYEPTRFASSKHDHYPPCIHTDCTARASEKDCFGVLGCSWCGTDQDGQTTLTPAVCLEQADCFGGVLHAASPYSRIYDQSLVLSNSEEDRSLSRAGPIGPVAGGIMAFFLFLALTVWAYKHWSSGERRPILNGSSFRINQIEEEAEDPAPGGGHQNYAHQGDPNQAISVVSPYRMNPTYRRPRPAGTDSDHGYSTMTPCGDQDSEVMSCLGEGGAAHQRRIRGRKPLSLQSVTSGTSSRTSSPLQGSLEMSSVYSEGKPSGGESSECQTLMEESSSRRERPNPLSRREEMSLRRRGEENQGRGEAAGVTVLNKNQFIVAATVHMVDTA